MRYQFLLILAVVPFWFSCGDDGDDPGGGNPPAETQGNLVGSVNLYDEGTTQADPSGMIVSIAGTSLTQTTNASGEYRFENLQYGNYDLEYNKTGYGTFKKFGISHQDLATFVSPNPSLGQESSSQITDLSTSVDGDNITVTVTTDPSGSSAQIVYVKLFFGTSADLNSTNYTAEWGTIPARINPDPIVFASDNITGLGFSSGETVYVRAYGTSFWSNEYQEPGASVKVWPNLNSTSPSAESFIVP